MPDLGFQFGAHQRRGVCADGCLDGDGEHVDRDVTERRGVCRAGRPGTVQAHLIGRGARMVCGQYDVMMMSDTRVCVYVQVTQAGGRHGLWAVRHHPGMKVIYTPGCVCTC
jgi:hypothetical protein